MSELTLLAFLTNTCFKVLAKHRLGVFPFLESILLYGGHAPKEGGQESLLLLLLLALLFSLELISQNFFHPAFLVIAIQDLMSHTLHILLYFG